MLRALTRTLTYNVGFHTEYMQSYLKQFKPNSLQSCVDVFKFMNLKKQYLPQNQVLQNFVSKLQYFLFYKNKSISKHSLFVYQQLKKLDIMTGSFKLQEQMQQILQKDMNVKNNQLQTLLWFIYREYPLFRETKFQDIAGEHSLRLFQILDYMNSEDKLPKWQPYLRVATLLKALGHEPQFRLDVTRQKLDQIECKYLPFIATIFDTQQKCQTIEKSLGIYNCFLKVMCEKYIQNDRMVNDAYLQYVETIDNERQGQQIQKYFQTLQWGRFVQLLELFMKTCQIQGPDQELAFKVNEIFWRIIESSKIDTQTSIIILKIISENHGKLDKYEGTIFSLILQNINGMGINQFTHVPGQGLLEIVRSIKRLPPEHQKIKKETYNNVQRHAKMCKIWAQGEKKQLLEQIQESGIQIQKEIYQILQS